MQVTDGAFSKTYTATVNANATTGSAMMPASDALTLASGDASFTAIVNSSTQASQTVVIHETLPTLAINAVDGNNVIDHAEASAGVTIGGTSTDLASGATFTISLTDGSFAKTYTATVGSNGAWTATVPSADAITLANGTATLSAQATDAYGNPSAVVTDSITVQETVPTLTISQVDGNNVINHAEAAAGVTITGASRTSPPARPSMSR